MARFASTIDNQPIYATRALNDKDGNQIDTTYAKLSDIPNVPVQDVTVDGTSVVNAQGVAEITTPTFTQVQADWTEANTAEPSYIQHKPNLAAVATSGDYSDLSNTPSIPTATSDLQNDSGFITSADIPVTDVEVDGVSVVSGGVASITMPSVPVTDVTVNGTSVVSSGVAAVTVPTATSDLTNDSGYITSAEAPVQDVTVNGTSVLSNGVAAVTVPTATSDLQNDSGFITSSDIPAQVQADWTEANSAEPSYIQHKPTLAAVATSGSYADLSNTPTINNVPAVTSSDDNKVLKASYTGGVGSYSWENETGTTYSAGTGIDIDQNNAISVENPLPSSTSADEGKVLKVDANGDPEWATGGGGTQVQSNWLEDDTTDPSYIENKPTPKTLVAGQGIAISESSASLTVTNTVARDAVNLVAGSGVTLTQSGSDLTISSAGTTYTAGEGIDITNDEISLESPVDLVAGPGITVDNPDGNTVRVSLASTPYNETVLWDNYTFANNKSSSVVMSENPFNFSCVRITFAIEASSETWPTVQTQIIDMVALNSCVNKYFTLNGTCVNGTTIYARCSKCHFNGTAISDDSSVQWYNGNNSAAMSGPLHIYRIVGINRIAGGN